MRIPVKTLGATIVAAALAFGPATAATAGGHPHHPAKKPYVELIGVVKKTGKTTAIVKAEYRCYGEPEQTHLWVSVKQSKHLYKRDHRLTLEGSSTYAKAWSQTHVNTLRCDGRVRVGHFEVHQREQGHGKLKQGLAYVQICIFDKTTGLGDTAVPYADNEFKKVVKYHHYHR